LSKSKKEYDSAKAAIQILIVILETLKGVIDNIFVEIVNFVIAELSHGIKSKSYKVSLIELVIIYN
jgi:hypothetical protein